MRAFVAGTDTAVGKTYVTALLAASLRASGLDTVALKPVSCGDREDAQLLRKACDGTLTLDEVNPIHLQSPLAPLQAAREEGRDLSLAMILDWFNRVAGKRASVLVEGAGGWLVPFAPGLTMADVAKSLGLPVLLVVANRLGCLNHTLLTLQSLSASGLPCLGLVLNHLGANADDLSRCTNRALLEETTGKPVLFEVANGQTRIPCA